MLNAFKTILLLVTISLSSSALDIDEKLTFRILQTSKSKKTILMNRGLEDGLAVGDHAKFFITTGVFARAVVIRATPARSVWSIYRIVRPSEIEINKVANLKIASPVRVTNDRSKSLQKTYPVKQLGEPVNISKKEPVAMASYSEEDEYNQIKESSFEKSSSQVSSSSKSISKPSKVLDKNIGLHASAGYNMLSGTYDNNGVSNNTDLNSVGFGLAAELLFPKSSEFLQKFSFLGAFNYSSGANGISSSTTTLMDFGVAANFHFTSPLATNRFIPYLELGFGFSLSTLDAMPESIGSSNTETLQGSGTYLSAGAGVKYTLDNAWGFYGKGEYVSNSTEYAVSSGTGEFTNTVSLSGFRLLAGAYMRF